MCREIITKERFSAIIDSIPEDALGTGFRLKGVYYSYAREESGIYKDEPYTKPAHIQISTKEKRFRIERVDRALRFSYDPTGGFNFVSMTERDSSLELADYFVELEHRLQAISSKQQAKRSAECQVDIKDLWGFIETVLEWCDENQRTEVQEATKLALTAPHEYLQAHKEQLTRRGIERPIRNLHIIALVDAMQEIQAATEVDWKADHGTLIRHISRIAKHFNIDIPQESTVCTKSVPEILRRLGKYVTTQGHALVTIDIDSDSYVICLVPVAMYGRSAELARKVGIEIRRF